MVTKAELHTRRMPRVEDSRQLHSLSNDEYFVSDEWIAAAFLGDVVRLGTGAEKRDTTYPPLREMPAFQTSLEDIEAFSAKIDRSEVLPPSVERYRHLQQTYGLPYVFGTAEQALTVLLHPFFRKGSYETMGAEYIRRLHKQLAVSSEYGQPLQLVVPTLPFKDQCAVTTRQQVECVDLGERLFLMRLDLLARSVAAVTHAKTSVHIVADGSVYADIFTQQNQDDVSIYFNSCSNLIKTLGLKTLAITDMQDIIATEPRFSEVRTSIKDHLSKIVADEDESVHLTWQALLRGMLFNCQLPAPFHDYNNFSALAGLELSETHQHHPQVYEVLTHAGLEYASFLLAMRKLHMLDRFFHGPGVIRATIHPKANQLGLQTLGSEVAPYNGVTIVDMDAFINDPRITNNRWYSCQRFYKMLQQHEQLSQIVDQDGNTFCYLNS